jgi:hypothetical protein
MRLRGCLFIVAAAVAVLLGLSWVVLPAVMSGVARGALESAGVHSDSVQVDVSASPPWRLIWLDADQVRVRAGGVRIEGLTAERLDVTLRDVSLSRRTFGVIEGQLDGVTMTPVDGPSVEVSSVALSGPAESATATLTLAAPQLGALVVSAAERQLGMRVTSVVLEAPDRLVMKLPGQSVTGQLVIDESGALLLVDPISGTRLALLSTDPSRPLRLRSLRVTDAGLEVTGTLDLSG